MFKSIIISLLLLTIVATNAKKGDEKPEWAKKDIRDFSDADMERLLEQWEEDDDPLEEDELPEHLRKPAKIDVSKLDLKNPEKYLQATKKGRTLMTFVNVNGNPTRLEADEITKVWQLGLWNNHIQAERYMVGDNRAIFMFADGSQAWTAKDFLIEQERCEGVAIDNQVYEGKHNPKPTKTSSDEL